MGTDGADRPAARHRVAPLSRAMTVAAADLLALYDSATYLVGAPHAAIDRLRAAGPGGPGPGAGAARLGGPPRLLGGPEPRRNQGGSP